MDIRKPIATNGGDWQQKFGEAWKSQIAAAKAKFGGAIEEVRTPPEYPTDVPILYVHRGSLVELLKFLKTDPQCDYNFLSDLTATDEEVEPRFEMVYNLFSRPAAGGSGSKRACAKARSARRSSRCGPAPTGPSAKCGTCTASSSRATPICAAS